MGSSMMPQKKNPGAVELIRGRAGRMNGLLMAGLTMMKGLPSGYNRDFHEEKEILAMALDLINRMIEVLPPLIQSTTINKERMAELSYGNFSTATELANYLVRSHGVSFRQSHHIVGSLVGELSRRGENFANFKHCMEHLRKNGIRADEAAVKRVLDPREVMLSYTSLGGTGPDAVLPMLAKFEAERDRHRAALKHDRERTTRGFEACRAIAGEASRTKTKEDLDRLIDEHRPRRN
jgi:argininosuccinate lyase